MTKTAYVIAVVNGKGGVGKTSTAANLAGILANEGYRVCAVDTDPQGDLGLDLGVQHAGQSDSGAALFDAARKGRAPEPLRGVRPHLDVVCGGPDLDELAAALTQRKATGRAADGLTLALRALAESGAYDLVIVDCPPGGHALQESVLAAARWLLVPAKTDYASLNGLAEIERRFTAARVTNPDLTLLGVFLFDVGVSSRAVLREARQTLTAALDGLPPETVLRSTIRHVEAAAQAARAYGLLAYELEQQAAAAPPWYERRKQAGTAPSVPPLPRSSAGLAGDYHQLAFEVLTRIAQIENPSEVTA